MFTHPFAYVMVGTFLAAVVTMIAGIAGLSKTDDDGTHRGERSTKLMALRVGLCALLLGEIILYVAFIK